MEKNIKKGLLLLTGVLVLNAWTSCTTEDQLHSPTSSDVEAIFTLKSPATMNGKITIREAYLKLDRLQATGSLGGDNSTDIMQPIPPEEPPYQLTKSDSGKLNFTLPFRVYDQLDFHLFLFQDSYDLIFRQSTAPETPDPGENNDDGSPDEGGSGENGDNDEGAGNENTGNDQDSGNSDNDSNDDDEDDQENQDNGDDKEDGHNDKDDDKKNENKNKNKNKDGDKGKNDKDDNDEDNDDDDDKDDDDEDEDERDDDDGRSGRSEKQTVNLADFFQNAKPAMVLVAGYENNGRMISIIFVVSDIHEIVIPARQNGAFALSLNQKNSAVITFDPEVLFEDIAPADIESAEIQPYQQQDVLFIHRDFNTHLYEVLSARLEQSAALNFQSETDL